MLHMYWCKLAFVYVFLLYNLYFDISAHVFCKTTFISRVFLFLLLGNANKCRGRVLHVCTEDLLMHSICTYMIYSILYKIQSFEQRIMNRHASIYI